MHQYKWLALVEKQLTAHFRKDISISKVNTIGGGDINEAYCLQTNISPLFIKINKANTYPQMFEKEALGLALLGESKVIEVPQLIQFASDDTTAFLILEYIDSAQQKTNFWDDFGTKLAKLHQQSNSYFGLDHDNYIGSLHQSNTQHKKWTDFFIEERLETQVKLARDSGKIGHDIIHQIENFYSRLDDIFPVEPPSLLHGDLWNGNYMVGQDGLALLIDPAVYYGHREMDLGMSLLFGGFDQRFYEAYHRQYPLEKGWKQRLEYCNLYPLLVHVNLFGGAYVGSVKSILKQF